MHIIHPRIAAILVLARSESESRNTLYRHSTASCTCARRYYLHLHNEQYAELLAETLPFVASLFFLSPSLSPSASRRIAARIAYTFVGTDSATFR